MKNEGCGYFPRESAKEFAHQCLRTGWDGVEVGIITEPWLQDPGKKGGGNPRSSLPMVWGCLEMHRMQRSRVESQWDPAEGGADGMGKGSSSRVRGCTFRKWLRAGKSDPQPHYSSTDSSSSNQRPLPMPLQLIHLQTGRVIYAVSASHVNEIL